MTQQDSKALKLRAAATQAVLCLVAFAVVVNLVTLEFAGWIQAVPLFIVGGSSLLLVATVACLTRRFLLVPPGSVVAMTAVLIALVWTCPITAGTRFFAAVRRVHVGTTQKQMQAILAPFPTMRSRYWHISLSPEAVHKTQQELQRASFTGTLLYAPDLGDGDAALITLRNGRVTDVATYVD